MKLNIKLITGFSVVALLVGFVGFFGINSNNTIQKNSQIALEIRELIEDLDDLFIDILLLIETEDLDDYQEIKSSFENTRIEFDILHEKNNEIIDKLAESFNQNVNDFTKISNGIIIIHKEKLARNREFDEKISLERDLRREIRAPILALENTMLTEDIGSLQYKSKEALFQYKDKKHVDEWLETIITIKNSLLVAQLPDVVEDINTYERISQDLGIIVVDQQIVEAEEHRKVQELQEIINRLEKNEEKIVTSIQAENNLLSQNTTSTLSIVILIAFIVSAGLGLFISRSISKPILKLKEAADKMGTGNLDIKADVRAKDETGDLAESFNKMAVDLKKYQGKLLESERKGKKELESEVNKKTKELALRIKELESFNKFSVGRENKMIELKKEIKELKKGLGEE